MKNLKVLSLAALLLVIFNISPKAQDVSLGGGLIIGTDMPPFGLQLKGTYGLDMMLEGLSASIGVSAFFPASKNNYDYWRMSADVDGNYTFFSTGDIEFFVLAGLNVTYYKREATMVGLSDNIGTTPGLNAGAGVNFNITSKLKAYSEFKYILSRYDQAVFTVGLLVGL